MSGTGYACIGHLFELVEDQMQEGCLRYLRGLVERIYAELDAASIRHANGLYIFDKFFRDVEVSVDSAQVFLSGVLKEHNLDEHLFQLKVEQTVWKVLCLHPSFYSVCNKYENSDVVGTNLCFQLFCLFNRFCEQGRIPMVMRRKMEKFLYSRFGAPYLKDTKNKDKKSNNRSNFLTFLEDISQVKDAFTCAMVKKAYDEYVPGILIKGKILSRVLTNVIAGGKQWAKAGKQKNSAIYLV